jgi:hypothetical protein
VAILAVVAIKNSLMEKKIFSAEHHAFYQDFTKWVSDIYSPGVTVSGIYKLLAPGPINRLIGQDQNGILYIGEGELSTRLGKLVNAINGTENRHTGGIRFSEKIKSTYNLKDCRIEISICHNHKEIERQLLEEYFHEFGELPPFNNKM